LLPFEDPRSAVHVAGNDMAAKFIADPEGALKVDMRAFTPAADRSELQSFVPGFHFEPPFVAARLGKGDNRKADPGASDGGADGDRLGIVSRPDPQPQSFFQRLDGANCSYVGDQSRE